MRKCDQLYEVIGSILRISKNPLLKTLGHDENITVQGREQAQRLSLKRRRPVSIPESGLELPAKTKLPRAKASLVWQFTAWLKAMPFTFPCPGRD